MLNEKKSIDDNILQRFEKIIGGKPHKFLRNGTISHHKDFEKILDDIENNKKIYIYEYIQISFAGLNIQQYISLKFISWLQKAFKCFVIIQIADNDKYLSTHFIPQQYIKEKAMSLMKDIISIGFEQEKTFIFLESIYSRKHSFQNTMIDIIKYTPICNLGNKKCLGEILSPLYEIAPCFPQTFSDIFGENSQYTCLTLLKQDHTKLHKYLPELAKKIKQPVPCFLYTNFPLSLNTNISSRNNTIYIHDSPEKIKYKIMRHADPHILHTLINCLNNVETCEKDSTIESLGTIKILEILQNLKNVKLVTEQQMWKFCKPNKTY